MKKILNKLLTYLLGRSMVATNSKDSQGFGDWSLSANAATYRDRRQESEILKQRLFVSSASTTGIAGPRGAGKSSLALKVLNECEKESDAFTHLIHSPIGYTSHEFLLSIFQNMCEEVIQRIDRDLNQTNTLDERATAELRRLRGILIASVIGLFLLFGGLVSYPAYTLYSALIEARLELMFADSHDMQARTSDLKESIDQLTEQIQLIVPNAGNPKPLLNELADKTTEYNWLLERQRQLEHDIAEAKDPLAIGVFIAPVLVTIFLFFISISLVPRAKSHFQRMRNTQENPLKVGLRDLATGYLEHLRFEITRSSQNQASVSFVQLGGILRSGRTATPRPLSLPTLTSELVDFLTRIAEVYGNRVVICLDELDKIEDPEDLEKLLRGIKGLLGHSKTHFLLTVSEDALARYTIRRRILPGMLESAFDSIISLERVSLLGAQHIVDTMHPKTESYTGKVSLHRSTALVWIFGTGIPREIKRNAMICLEEKKRLRSAKTLEIWKILYRRRLIDIESWAARVGGDDRSTCQFLSSLHKTIFLFDDKNAKRQYDMEWIREVGHIWMVELETMCEVEMKRWEVHVTDVSNVTTDTQRNWRHFMFSRAIVEILICTSSLAFFVSHSATHLDNKAVDRLTRIFEHMPYNIHFAIQQLRDHLLEVHVLLDGGD